MDDQKLESLLENEREWRRYIVNQFEMLNKRVGHLEMWSLVFRLAGAAAVTFLWLWIEVKMTNLTH